VRVIESTSFRLCGKNATPTRPISESLQSLMAGIAQIPAHETYGIKSWAIALLQPTRRLFESFLAHVVLPVGNH